MQREFFLQMHDAQDFVEGGFAFEGAKDAVHEHGDHAVLDGFFFEFEIEGAAHNEILDLFVKFQDFGYDEALLVAGTAAFFASAGNPVFAWNRRNNNAGLFIEQFQNLFDRFTELALERSFFLAIAETANEALGHIGAAGVHDIVGAHAH